jgi:Carboxypeptidase regulatory-like domain/TonB dependent receptor
VHLLCSKSWKTHFLVFFVLLFSGCIFVNAQSFRGGINGTVVDSSGAAIQGTTVTATNDGTAVARNTVSSSAGEFSFQDLPVGSYTVTVTGTGFTTERIGKIAVSAGSIYTLPVKLSVSGSVQEVNVNAASIALDTTSTTQTTDIPTQVVNNAPNNGRDFTQLIQFTPGFAGYSIDGGVGVSSVNGTRSNQINWQIEGTDNNDLWYNIPAVNQGGVSGIPGIVLPLDAIDQFSFVSNGSPESGRNAGGTVNLSIKSGTNQVHGSIYYFNRNEFFAASSPFANGTPKNKTRDIDYGFSLGAPIWRGKTFFFLSYEHQNFLIGNQQNSTEPSGAYQAEATSVLKFYGVPVNPVSQALLTNLWPAAALTGPATPDNYLNPGTENGHSFNGLIKLDHSFDTNNQLSVKWYAGQGSQTAPLSSYLSPYYEVAPVHVQNYSITYNHVFSPAIVNQIFIGVSYFNQAFSDANHSYNPVALGLNTGVTAADLSGAPLISIAPPSDNTGGASTSGFDEIGPTSPAGRNDITGHLDDALSYSVGKHQFRFGGEYRQAQVDDFYQTGARGNFTFDGSQGPWNLGAGSAACNNLATQNVGTSDPVSDPNVYLLADFLAGCVSTSSIVEGDQKRQVFENTFDLFGQDAWQITSKLNLNYGIRYDFADAIHDSSKDLSSFDPTISGGFAIQGNNVNNLYTPYKGAFSPRIGAAYAVHNNLVLRAGFGIYFDTPYLLPLLALSGTTNNGALGVGNNPAGAAPVATASVNNYVIAANQPIFPSLTDALAGEGVTNVYSVNPNYRQSYTYSYNVNLQQSLGSGVIAQIGYVGTLSRRLTEIQDTDQAALNSANFGNAGVPYPANLPACNLDLYTYQQCSRPFFSQYPNIGTVNQLESDLNSNYNSLQTILRTSAWHGLTTQVTYTWSHALDYETGLVPYLPQNSFDVAAEYSNSDFDTRNTFSEFANYIVPSSHVGPKLLTNGWELNSTVALHGGQPFSVISNTSPSGNGEYADRAQLVLGINPFAGVSHKIVDGSVTWFNAAAFADAAPGTYSTTRRNMFYNPGFEDIDLSVFKNTKITDRLSSQFRVEMFNVLNHTNLAPVGAPQISASGTIGSTIGTYEGAPGIGPGEPFNVQFALKLIF